jgi:hypothetical protein
VLDFCVLKITQSRIHTGLIAIRKESAELLFPPVRTRIKLLMTGSDKAVIKLFAPFDSSTREARIYGMSDWYRANEITAGTRVSIERLSRREWLYSLMTLLPKDFDDL